MIDCALTVSKSPTSDRALQDVVTIHPEESDLFEDGILCRLKTEKGVLHLPLKVDARVTAGALGLASFQRSTLRCDLNSKVNVSLVHRILPRVSKVWITILSQRCKENVQTKNIVKKFQGKFKSHPLIQGHIIPLKVGDRLYRITIDRMISSSEESEGVMKENCRVVPKFRYWYGGAPDKGCLKKRDLYG